MLLSIGDRVAEGAHKVHSRFDRVVNFAQGRRLLTLAGPGIGAGPLNLLVRGVNLRRVHALFISPRAVVLDGARWAIAPARRYRSAIALERMDAARFEHNLGPLVQYMRARAAPKSMAFLLDEARYSHFRPGFERAVAEHLRRGAERLAAGDVDGVRMLRGCGFGLTPSGDDFLAGWLLGLHVARRLRGADCRAEMNAVCAAAGHGSLLSDAFLAMAREGRVTERMREFITALARGGRADVHRAAGRLFEVGATSGADLAVGFYKSVSKAIGVEEMSHGRDAHGGQGLFPPVRPARSPCSQEVA